MLHGTAAGYGIALSSQGRSRYNQCATTGPGRVSSLLGPISQLEKAGRLIESRPWLRDRAVAAALPRTSHLATSPGALKHRIASNSGYACASSRARKNRARD